MASCAGNPGELSIGGGSAAAGGALTLAMDQAQATGAIPLLAFAPQAAPSWPACGTLLPGIGELLIDVSSPNAIVVLGGPAWSGARSAFQLPVPYNLFGSTLFAQGLFVDLAGSAPGEPFRATDGLRLFLGL